MHQLSYSIEHWPLKQPFVTSRGAVSHFETLYVEIRSNGFVGRGEAFGVPYKRENATDMAAQIEHYRDVLENQPQRTLLSEIFPPGGARNAIDCALWDLEAKSSGKSVWRLCNIDPKPVETVATVSVGEPDVMARQAKSYTGFPLLKVKLDAVDVIKRVEAVRAAVPDARLIVDANEAWSFDQLVSLAPELKRMGVEMIEQPLPRSKDRDLLSYQAPVPIAADESCDTAQDISALIGRYDIINVKLDKCGGLTEAFRMISTAKNHNLGVMVGSMGGTSLAMAPAFAIAQLAQYVDIDGPILLARDRANGMKYNKGIVSKPDSSLWG